jgi:SulP family sulfate permease
MAIDIGSHDKPAQDLYTTIVGGFVVSLLSGSQLSRSAGRRAPACRACRGHVQQHGMDGLILATILSGIMLMESATSARHLHQVHPYPVTVGFAPASRSRSFRARSSRCWASFRSAEPGRSGEDHFPWSHVHALAAAVGLSFMSIVLLAGLRFGGRAGRHVDRCQRWRRS